jgi:F-type H+-transporting ATPase subunit a
MRTRPLFHTASLLIISLLSCTAFAQETHGPGIINVYELIADHFSLDHKYTALFSSLITLLICTLIGLAFRRTITHLDEKKIAPSGKISLQLFVEMICDFIYSLTKEHCGHHYKKFLPLMAGLFIFILVCNISGLLPGFPPATENFSINLSMGFIVFLTYNIAGIKEHGASYIKQFTGPFLLLAPLFLSIELISHAVRPESLAFRLQANIFCDHLLLSVFSNLAPLVIPSLFLFFGLLVAVIQSFVFALLTGIYINMAISHDH